MLEFISKTLLSLVISNILNKLASTFINSKWIPLARICSRSCNKTPSPWASTHVTFDRSRMMSRASDPNWTALRSVSVLPFTIWPSRQRTSTESNLFACTFNINAPSAESQKYFYYKDDRAPVLLTAFFNSC